MIKLQKSISYYHRGFIYGCIPHRKINERSLIRSYGNIEYAIQAPPQHCFSLPSGPMARCILHYLCWQAKVSNNRIVQLAYFSDFFKLFDYPAKGANYGIFREELLNIIGARFSVLIRNGGNFNWESISIVDKAKLVFPSPAIRYIPSFVNTSKGNALLLGESFFSSIMNGAFPLKFSILRKIKKSSLALDVYAWWAAKTFNAKPHKISWADLSQQFTSSNVSLAKFKQWFKNTIMSLLPVCPKMSNMVLDDDYLVYLDVDPHVCSTAYQKELLP